MPKADSYQPSQPAQPVTTTESSYARTKDLAQRLNWKYDTDLTNDLMESLSLPSYTAPELQQLVHEFTGPGLHGLQNTAIALSYSVALDSFIEWLAGKEAMNRNGKHRRET